MRTAEDSTIDAEYLILENIYTSSGGTSLRQREIARLARTSLGMTNSILKRLAQKGWITIQKLNSRNIRYAVTIDGLNEIILRSYGYFKRTIKNVAFYRDSIASAIQSAARNGAAAVLLVGNSDLDFIIEHVCRHSGLGFSRCPSTDAIPDDTGPQAGNILVLFSESIPLAAFSPAENSCYLAELILKGPALQVS